LDVVVEQSLCLLGQAIIFFGFFDLALAGHGILYTGRTGSGLSSLLMPMSNIAFWGCHRIALRVTQPRIAIISIKIGRTAHPLTGPPALLAALEFVQTYNCNDADAFS
jgi:hypothetical protein